MIEKNTEVGGNASFVEGMFAINSKMQNEKTSISRQQKSMRQSLFADSIAKTVPCGWISVNTLLEILIGVLNGALIMFEDSLASNGGDSLFKPDNIAELAGKFCLDSDTLQTTLDHYNELCDKGTDEDFGKTADKMVAIMKR